MGNSGYCFRDVAQERKLGGQVDQARRVRCEARPQVDVAESVGAARAHAALIIMRQKFGFVGGDVNADRAIALASFAGEAEVERLFDFFAAPAVANDSIFSSCSLRHFPEQVSAAASGVLFFAGDAIAGAHHAAFFAAALSHSNAAQGGEGQAAMIGGKLKASLGFPRSVIRAETKVLVEFVGRLLRQTNDFAGIHFAVGVPCRLEFAECLHEFRAKHFRQQFGAGLAVAVFAGERAAIADDEIGGLLDELAELGDAFFRLQVEVEARVHAAIAEVAVERAFVAELGHHLAQVAEIAAEFFGRDRGVFPSFPVQRLAGHVRSGAEAGFANVPDALGPCAGIQLHLRRRWRCG